MYNCSCNGDCKSNANDNNIKEEKIKSILITDSDLYNLNNKINEFYKTITSDQFQYITEVGNNGQYFYVMIGISE